MRKFITALLLLLILVQFATAELTKEDLKEIEKLLDKQKEEIKSYIDLKVEVLDTKIKALDTKIEVLGTKVEELDTKVKELSTKVEALDKKVETLDKKVGAINVTIAGLEKAIEIFQWVIGMLALFLAAGIILPLVLQVLRERKRILLTERIEKLEQQLADLREQKIVK